MRKPDTYFQGKNVIITGGSSGIGKATAQLLAECGANVSIIARDEAKLDQALQEIKAEAGDPHQQNGAYSVDVEKYARVEAAVDAIEEAGGAPDILINCAGMVYPGHFEELPLSTFEEQMGVNYFGTLHTVKAVLPRMLLRGSGHIVNVSSMAGVVGGFGYTAYAASKFAVCGFTEALRAEMKPRGIGVSLVLPPDTDTPQLRAEQEIQPLALKMITGSVKPKSFVRPGEIIAHYLTRWLLTDDGQPMSPDCVAKAILEGIRKGRFMIIPDTTLRIAFLLRGIVIPLGNWAQDQLAVVARREQPDW